MDLSSPGHRPLPPTPRLLGWREVRWRLVVSQAGLLDQLLPCTPRHPIRDLLSTATAAVALNGIFHFI